MMRLCILGSFNVWVSFKDGACPDLVWQREEWGAMSLGRAWAKRLWGSWVYVLLWRGQFILRSSGTWSWKSRTDDSENMPVASSSFLPLHGRGVPSCFVKGGWPLPGCQALPPVWPEKVMCKQEVSPCPCAFPQNADLRPLKTDPPHFPTGRPSQSCRARRTSSDLPCV